jgi:hypothetical protein
VQPAAGDLFAVDHTVLRNGVHPQGPGQRLGGVCRAAPAWRDRVTVEPGRDRLKPVTRMVRQLPAGRQQPDQVVIPRVWLLAGFVPGRPGG